MSTTQSLGDAITASPLGALSNAYTQASAPGPAINSADFAMLCTLAVLVVMSTFPTLAGPALWIAALMLLVALTTLATKG